MSTQSAPKSPRLVQTGPGLEIGPAPTIGAIPSPIGAPPAAAPERPLPPPKPAKGGWWWGVGRRKRAVARVRIRPVASGPGAGTVTIQMNASKKTKTVEQYFAEDRDRTDAVAALTATGIGPKLEVFARLNGGGYMGQAQALKLALARALRDYDPTTIPTLRDQGLLTRDAREVERKKYGQAGARRRFQFSKR